MNEDGLFIKTPANQIETSSLEPCTACKAKETKINYIIVNEKKMKHLGLNECRE
jgi:hypothetical protein